MTRRRLISCLGALVVFFAIGARAQMTVTGIVAQSSAVARTNLLITFTPISTVQYVNPWLITSDTISRRTSANGGFSVPLLQGNYVARLGTMTNDWMTIGVSSNSGTADIHDLALTNLTYTAGSLPIMVGATADTDGAAGLVPAPLAGEEGKVLQGDGTWVDQTGGSGGGISASTATNIANSRIVASNLVNQTQLDALATAATNKADAIGLAGSNNVTAAIGALSSVYQPLDAELTGWSGLSTNALTNYVLKTDYLSDWATLGTASTHATGDYQATNANLTKWSTLTTNVLANYALISSLGSAAYAATGDFQPASGNLDLWAAISTNYFASYALLTQMNTLGGNGTNNDLALGANVTNLANTKQIGSAALTNLSNGNGSVLTNLTAFTLIASNTTSLAANFATAENQMFSSGTGMATNLTLLLTNLVPGRSIGYFLRGDSTTSYTVAVVTNGIVNTSVKWNLNSPTNGGGTDITVTNGFAVELWLTCDQTNRVSAVWGASR